MWYWEIYNLYRLSHWELINGFTKKYKLPIKLKFFKDDAITSISFEYLQNGGVLSYHIVYIYFAN